ncbi:uncharacterized protein LOC127518974 isoform X3 [Ctenopharyngodon idella]|uniref:uncharacterized protein LOC127518974 isoform X3 n=1 Tax=Ctenopharyngodon idella TaxID=7959 RepID=UPI002232871D|nr:uncharacterized protein LOC127518974 isoform X3 [Ctenopharyngodon idella]
MVLTSASARTCGSSGSCPSRSYSSGMRRVSLKFSQGYIYLVTLIVRNIEKSQFSVGVSLLFFVISSRLCLSVSEFRFYNNVQNMLFFLLLLFVDGVVGETDEVKSESVMEGKSVTLWNDVEVQRDDLMVWRFGDKGILLAKIDVETNETSLNNADERFRDRLQLNPNGSLTIKDTKTLHTGLYELQIRGRESAQRFLLSVTAVPGLSPGVVAVIVFTVLLVVAAAVVIYYRRKVSELQKQMVKNVPATEGKSVILRADLTKIEKDDTIQWYYEDEDNRIAEFKAGDRSPDTFPGADGRFRGKLNLDKTGDLSITDIRTIYSGLYILKLSNSRRTKYKRFSVSVKPKEESVRVGGSVALRPDLSNAKIETDELILWTFGAEKSLVATNAARPNKTDERFTDRVELDEETGSLTISNIRAEDVGHYKLQIINSKETKGWRVNLILNDSTGNEPATAATSLL